MKQNEIIQILKRNSKAYIAVHTLSRSYLCYLNCMSDDGKRVEYQRRILFKQVCSLEEKGIIKPDYDNKRTKETTLYYYNKEE